MNCCKACNMPLNWIHKLQPDGSPEDLCRKCLIQAGTLYIYTKDHEYIFGETGDLLDILK